MGEGLVLVMRCKWKQGMGEVGDLCTGGDLEIGKKYTPAIQFYFGGATTQDLICCLYMTAG